MTDLPDDWTLPAIDPSNERWFTSGELAVQHCPSCDVLQHPPEELCHRCGSFDLDHRVLAPTGTIHSFTVVHYPAHPRLADAVPYVVVLVALDDAPEIRVVGNLPGDGRDVSIGMPVHAVWRRRTDDDGVDVLLPDWVTERNP